MGDLYFLPRFAAIIMHYLLNREGEKKQKWVRRKLSSDTLWWEVSSLALDSADSLCDSKDLVSHQKVEVAWQ